MDSEYEILFTDDAKRRQKMVEMNDERNTMMAALMAGERKSWALSQPRAPAPPVLRYDDSELGSQASFGVVIDSSSDTTPDSDAAEARVYGRPSAVVQLSRSLNISSHYDSEISFDRSSRSGARTPSSRTSFRPERMSIVDAIEL